MQYLARFITGFVEVMCANEAFTVDAQTIAALIDKHLHIEVPEQHSEDNPDQETFHFAKWGALVAAINASTRVGCVSPEVLKSAFLNGLADHWCTTCDSIVLRYDDLGQCLTAEAI